MTCVLLLGGTGEGRRLAGACAGLPLRLVYSVAGLTSHADLPCEIRTGGFGGEAGLLSYLQEQPVDLVIDATHPYAAAISRNLQAAAKRADCPAWALRRPRWRPRPADDWRPVEDWHAVLRHIEPFATVLFTIGREPLRRAEDRPSRQRWIVRTLARSAAKNGLTVLAARGPFALAAELELFSRLAVEVLVAKNSGGVAVAAKLAAARALRLPVVMLERPPLPPLDREFQDSDSLLTALREWARARSAGRSVSR